jgi:peptide/nickel transport system substrate-binding protein
MNKKILAFSVCILMMTVMFSGCVEEEFHADTLIIESISEARRLDPASDYESAGWMVIQNVYEGLVALNGTDSHSVVPLLAESWDISEDKMNYTFYLRKGVKFHDGTDFNADSVVYSLNRALKMGQGPSWMLSQCMDLNSTQKMDDYTVRIRLKNPYPSFLLVLTTPVAAIVSPTYVEANGGVKEGVLDTWMNEHMCGTGPFKFDSWTHNQQLTLIRNEEYWREPARLERVIIKTVDEISVRVMDLEKGDADVIYVPLIHMDKVEGKEGIKIYDDHLSYAIDFICMNCKQGPMANKLVRQAFSHAIDYKTIQETIFKEYAVPYVGPLPRGMWGYNESVQPYTYDPQKAVDLLKQAGYHDEDGDGKIDDFPIVTIWYNSGNDARSAIAVNFQSTLREIGVGIEIREAAWPPLLDKDDKAELDMLIIGWVVDYDDPDDYAYPLLNIENGGSAGNGAWYNNTDVNEWTEVAKTMTDEKERLEIYNKIQRQCTEDAPYIWVAQQKEHYVCRDWVKGHYYNPCLSECDTCGGYLYPIYKER